MTLGDFIKNYRAEHKISQRKLAERCKDVSNGYIAMLESGKNPATGKPIVPSIDKLVSLANGMNMSLGELFNSVDDMPVFVGEDAKLWDAYMENGADTERTGNESTEARRVSAGIDRMPPDVRKKFFEYMDMSIFASYFEPTDADKED